MGGRDHGGHTGCLDIAHRQVVCTEDRPERINHHPNPEFIAVHGAYEESTTVSFELRGNPGGKVCWIGYVLVRKRAVAGAQGALPPFALPLQADRTLAQTAAGPSTPPPHA